MYKPCENCCKKRGKSYSKECDSVCMYAKVVAEKRRLQDTLDILANNVTGPIQSIEDLAVFVCENLDCDKCPVLLENADIRSECDKKVGNVSCYISLVRWIQKKVQEG